MQVRAAAALSDLCLACKCSPRRDLLPSPQVRAAAALSDLARGSECKQQIVTAGGVEPLVKMLGASSAHKVSVVHCL